MNFAIQRPASLYGLLLLIPVLFFSLYRYKRLLNAFSERNSLQRQSHGFNRFKHCFIFRTLFRSLALVCIVLAYSGISLGVSNVPVQKNGSAVSFVFDISHSMNGKDEVNGMSRLDAAKEYAGELLSHLNGCAVSVVIAKGSGSVAIPLTEDFSTIRSFLSELTSDFMTSQGSSLGSGIDCAVLSFPPQSSYAGNIWLFTDGEETDSKLSSSINESLKYGIPVSIIGFGSEKESEILAGDGITKVKSALRKEKILDVIKSIENKRADRRNPSRTKLTYVTAKENGSASTLLKMLKNESGSRIVYELRLIDRHNVFIILAIVFFILSFISAEFDFSKSIGSLAKETQVLCLLLLFTGCSQKFNDGTKLLEGKLEWNRKNYQKAISYFLEVEQNADARKDRMVYEYAACNLAASYLMQDELDVALEKYKELIDNATNETSAAVKYSAYYNSGIIAHRKGNYEQAADFFKKALEINSSDINAKINFELSQQGKSGQNKGGQQELLSVQENSDNTNLENSIYSIIKESEHQQWKNQQKKSQSSSLDY